MVESVEAKALKLLDAIHRQANEIVGEGCPQEMDWVRAVAYGFCGAHATIGGDESRMKVTANEGAYLSVLSNILLLGILVGMRWGGQVNIPVSFEKQETVGMEN